MQAQNQIRAEDALTQLACVSRGTVGGEPYKKYHKKLVKLAGYKTD